MLASLLLALLLGVPFTIINFTAYLKGSPPTGMNIASTILFLIIWLIWGFYMNDKNKGNAKFLKFSTLYWLLAFAFVLVSYSMDWLVLAIPAVIVFLGPLYGLRQFLPNLSYESFAYMSLIMAYAISLTGYCLGHMMNSVFDWRGRRQ